MTYLDLDSVKQASLIGMVLVASWQDIRDRIISNRLVSLGAGIGISLAFFQGGQGLWTSLSSGVVMFLSFLLMHMVGWIGAGDVKLAGATGLYFRIDQSLELVLLIMFLSGVISIVWILMIGLQNNILKYFQNPSLTFSMGSGLPYAVSICSGVLLYLWVK
jgi:Flp pilus assembly protein protease CpaA